MAASSFSPARYANLDCSDCFVDFNADVFIAVSIRGFSMQNVSAGFRNMVSATPHIVQRRHLLRVCSLLFPAEPAVVRRPARCRGRQRGKHACGRAFCCSAG